MLFPPISGMWSNPFSIIKSTAWSIRENVILPKYQNLVCMHNKADHVPFITYLRWPIYLNKMFPSLQPLLVFSIALREQNMRTMHIQDAEEQLWDCTNYESASREEILEQLLKSKKIMVVLSFVRIFLASLNRESAIFSAEFCVPEYLSIIWERLKRLNPNRYDGRPNLVYNMRESKIGEILMKITWRTSWTDFFTPMTSQNPSLHSSRKQQMQIRKLLHGEGPRQKIIGGIIKGKKKVQAVKVSRLKFPRKNLAIRAKSQPALSICTTWLT